MESVGLVRPLSQSATSQTSVPFLLFPSYSHYPRHVLCIVHGSVTSPVELSSHLSLSFFFLCVWFSAYFCPCESVKTFIKAVSPLFFHCLKDCLGERTRLLLSRVDQSSWCRDSYFGHPSKLALHCAGCWWVPYQGKGEGVV